MNMPAAAALRSCLADLSAASNVDEFRLVRLSAKLLDDGLVVEAKLTDEHRLSFRQNHIQPPKLECGSIDWSNVSRIKILSVDHA